MKKTNKELNRFELVWSSYSKHGYFTKGHMEHELQANYGTYNVFKGLHFISYGKKFLDETKLKIINNYDYDMHWSNLSFFEDLNNNPNLDYNQKSLLFSFRDVKRSYEMVGLRALISIGTDIEPFYWEHWLRLEDGTILTPKETKEYFAINGGIEVYILKDPMRAKLETN